MKRLAGLTALAAMLSSVGGCGWLWGEEGYFRDRGSDYLEARQTAPMRLPPNVEAKRLDPLLPVPLSVADMQHGSEFEVPRPQSLRSVQEVSEFSLQQSGDSRWLVAQRAPAEIWPMLRQFFEDNGFNIAEERLSGGEFITAWQPLEALSAPMARRLGGRAAEQAAGSEVRVRVRVEPGVQRNSSEIFVSSALRSSGGASDTGAVGRGDAGLDAALLDEMNASLTRSAERGGSVSLLAARDFDAPSRVTLSEDGNGNPFLSLDADFDRAWSSVGRALEMGDVRVEDINRSLGVYYINLAERADRSERPGFLGRLFGRGEDPETVEARAERYQVRLTRIAEGVQVTVEKDMNTFAPEEVARRVLNMLQEHLG
ncbi:outer membrane protein assembly factor BamC [Azotobacter salinestris]|uniref:outer membrane protein assembly factor BamC n=1 Tax=Azotobacter salinestris TaxID=69964 RepID=UPI0032E04D4C